MTLNVSLPKALEDRVREQVASGRYGFNQVHLFVSHTLTSDRVDINLKRSSV